MCMFNTFCKMFCAVKDHSSFFHIFRMNWDKIKIFGHTLRHTKQNMLMIYIQIKVDNNK